MAGLNNDKQTVKVSEEVVSMIAAKAALRVPGVSRLSGEFADKVTRKFLGRDNIARGISISKEEEGLGIDIYLNVEFGAKIQSVFYRQARLRPCKHFLLLFLLLCRSRQPTVHLYL